MPEYSITGPDGKTYSIEGPAGATREQIIGKIKERMAQPPPSDQRGPVEKLFGIGGERYQTWPEKLVRGVVGGVAGAVETGAEMTGEALRGEMTQESLREDVERGRVLGPASLGVSGAPGAARALAAPVEQFAERLARTYPERLEEHARRKVVGRLEAGVKGGGATPEQAVEQVTKAQAAGRPRMLADEESLRGLAGNVARQPGASQAIAKEALYGRDAGAAQRISEDIAKYIHGGPSMHRTTEALLQQRSAAGRPAYEAMEKLQGIWSPRLQQFLDEPALKSGMARGYELERWASLAEGREFNPTQLGVDLDAEGNIVMLAKPNMRVLDMGKQGLDAMIAEERHELTGRLSARGVALEKVRKAYVGLLDQLDTSGTYRAAREAWAGPSQALDATRLGRTSMSKSPEEIARDFADLSPTNQQFFKVGVADLLRERLAKTGMGGDEAKSIIRNPWMRDQLRPVFRSDAEFNEFTEAVAQESHMHNTLRRTFGGSETAGRIAEDTSQDLHTMMGGADIAHNLVSGNWVGALGKYLRMKRDLGIRQNPELNERIARLLFSPNPNLEAAAGTRGGMRGATAGYMQGAADVLQAGTPALIPGAASSLTSQPSQDVPTLQPNEL